MSNSVVLFLVLVFSLANLAMGLFTAAFFGYGPWRASQAVRFLSDPRIPPPAFPRFPRPFQRASNRQTAPHNQIAPHCPIAPHNDEWLSEPPAERLAATDDGSPMSDLEAYESEFIRT